MKAKKFTKETILDIGYDKNKFNNFDVGDTIRVAQKIAEGDKERLQYFEGFVVRKHKQGIASTFTVRKLGANGIFVERIFPLYSPVIDSIDFVRKGKVRRAKLYYMRDRIGKAANVQEKVLTKEQKESLKNKSESY